MKKSIFFHKWLLLWFVSFTTGARISLLLTTTASNILIELWEPTTIARNDLFFGLLRYRFVIDILVGILFVACATAITLAIDQMRSKNKNTSS